MNSTSKKYENKSKANPSTMNMISERSEIIGTLKSKRDIRVAGSVDGGVEADGKVIIADTGHVDGSINSADAHIAGHVEGDVHVSNKLTLAASAVVESDIYTKLLTVEEGATFNGKCNMNADEQTSKQKDTSEPFSKKSDSVLEKVSNNGNNHEEALSA